jgi:hypothetical protein
MTRTQLAQGSLILVAVTVAGFASTAQLDRHFAAAEAGRKTTADNGPEVPAPACVGKDGSWKNWPWSNVPALSPKCSDDR